MMRALIPALLLAAPAWAQSTPMADRPGRWMSVPQEVAEPAPPRVAEAETAEPFVARPPAAVVQTPDADTLRPVQRPIAPEIAVQETPDVALEVVTPLPPQPLAAPAVQPVQRPRAVALADRAAALAEDLTSAAREIATTPAAPVPDAEVNPVPIADEILAALQITRVPVTPLVADTLPAALSQAQIAVFSAVLLPSAGGGADVVARPAALRSPAPDTAPSLSRPRPEGPAAMERAAALAAPPVTARVAAVLLPAAVTSAPRLPTPARLDQPQRARFPMSALPPSALPEGPAALERIVIGRAPQPAAMAAVLVAAPAAPVDRIPAPTPSRRPAAERVFISPEAPPVLPAPDPNAIARLVEEAGYCWRLANLGPEARWAELRVAVALDETNHASAASIHLTGFARVVSGAAEEAYRAAHNALTACGAATGAAPATSHATLIFDRDGIRVR